MKLIRATEDDMPVLTAIEETARDLIVYNWGFTDEEMRQWIRDETVYLIEEDGVIVGDISYRVKDTDYAYVSGLIIAPEFQRRGLARKAMGMLLEELREFDRVSLDVHPDNHAVKLYESLGFVASGREDNLYGDGQPRIIMTRECDTKERDDSI
ncbi:MAG: GNAT family N-acetyltransferase [Candidatus Moranbacteria bacterium]|nr:GNAT family N-acetyltransferase [Candidatus Moranbacteria bacterium]NTW45802.1 GNAT family N-acetyltransferase [Candidatus Moranbacteria bacterium]